MNLDAIEACKEMDTFIRKLPEDHWDEAFDLFFRVKRALLSADEYVETLNEPLKTNKKNHLMRVHMHLRIRDVCVEDEISVLLFEEYLITQSRNEDHRQELLAGLRERFKEVYEQHAYKIAVYREELGLVNPHNEDHRREVFAGLRAKEVCSQHADKICVYRSGSGLVNPHEA